MLQTFGKGLRGIYIPFPGVCNAWGPSQMTPRPSAKNRFFDLEDAHPGSEAGHRGTPHKPSRHHKTPGYRPLTVNTRRSTLDLIRERWQSSQMTLSMNKKIFRRFWATNPKNFVTCDLHIKFVTLSDFVPCVFCFIVDFVIQTQFSNLLKQTFDIRSKSLDKQPLTFHGLLNLSACVASEVTRSKFLSTQ